MNAVQLELYEKICKLEITPPTDPVTFHNKLANENGWDLSRAIAVDLEYRRFLLMALVADHVVCPSEDVDAAWHLHLIYSRSYWNDFCGIIAGKPFHHEPSRGGNELGQFKELYRQTLETYLETFGSKPPLDIWPTAERRFDPHHHSTKINRADYWMIRRPRWLKAFKWRGDTTPNMAIAPLWMGIWNPLDWRGLDFLILYALLSLIVIAITVLIRRKFGWGPAVSEINDESVIELKPYDIAYLSKKSKGVCFTGIAELVSKGLVKVDSSRKVTALVLTKSPPDLHPVPRAILTCAQAAGAVELYQLSGLIQFEIGRIRERLDSAGLIESLPTFLVRLFMIGSIYFGLVAFGVAKIVVGVNREKPVGFLVLLTIAAVVAGVALCWIPHRTAKGNRLLKSLRVADPVPRSNHSDQKVSTEDVVRSVALFGVAAGASILLGNDVINAYRYLDPFWGQPGRSASSGCTSGCRRGCFGGSGCGGGGSGGGCGGCSGG